MVEGKPAALQRLATSLGSNIFEVEMLRDRVEELTLQLAERDATINELREAADDAAGNAAEGDS